MRKKTYCKYLIGITLLCVCSYSLAQKYSASSSDYHISSAHPSPEMIQKGKALGEKILDKRNFLASSKRIRTTAESESAYIVPVVVHIIVSTQGSICNPTDADVYSMIAKLNDVYNNNPGAAIPITFQLAKTGPDCQPTTGIIRVDATTFGGVAHENTSYNWWGIKYYSSDVGPTEDQIKALSHWPREQYLNIWIVNNIGNKGGSISAYSYQPQNLSVASRDGIVLDQYQINSTSTTLPHEVGHYLGLYHTFEGSSGTSCPANLLCSIQGDRVCDTDPHSASLPGNADPTTANPCVSGHTLGLLTRNMMSYFYLRDQFTQGQSDLAMATLLAARSTLLTSPGNEVAPTSTIPAACVSSVNMANATNTRNIGPAKILLNTLNYTSAGYSGDSKTYYIDHSCELGTTLYNSEADTLRTSIVGTYAQRIKAWIDFNNNGNFEAAELILDSVGTNKTFVVPIPATLKSTSFVVNDVPLRMRIASDASSAANFGACDQLTYGQVEDFYVTITEKIALSAKLSGVQASISSNLLSVNWNTESEKECNHFEIEGSNDGKTFFEIDQIASKAQNGNSDTRINYTFNKDLSTFNSKLALSLLAAFILMPFAYSKKMESSKKLALATICLVVLVLACNKSNNSVQTSKDRINYVRIVQISKDGSREASGVVKVVMQ